MKILDLLEAQPVMQRLVSQKMPAKLAYAIAKNIKLVNDELEIFDSTRVKLLAENWEIDENTQQYKIPDEDKPKWKKMYDELISEEVKLDIYMIDASMLEGLEMTPGEVLAIGWMLRE